jgi:ATP-dependent RNA helicase DDX43
MEKIKNQPDIVKNFYKEPPNQMSYGEAVEFRKKNFNIKIELFKKENLKFCSSVSNSEPEKDRTPEETEEYLSQNVPSPFRTFQEGFSRYPDLLEELRLQKFEKPTPIQSQMWPILLKGLDCVGIAQTGTGKTLAFLLPALIHIDGQTTPRSERLGPNVLVLSPTRELALQIEQEVKKINYKGIKSVCIYGGGDRKEQISVCTRGVEIIIGTPGRLYDLMKAGAINVTSVTYLVMDEADRMLDLGFEPQILKILLDIRPDRQTVMTSATWPSGVRRLATKYLKEPIQLYVDTLDLRAAKSVEQHIVILKAEDDKTTMLMDYIENKMEPEDKLIVFVSRKSTADTLSCDLILKNISCQSIHGDREQCDREQALEDFKESYVKILIATDVASRGIDVKDITCVFNYDFPHNMEEYVHRVGRTGRAGRTGKSITLMTRQDWKNAKELIEILQEGGQEVLPELIDMAERYEAMKRRKMEEEGSFGGGGRGGRGGRGGGSGCFNCGKEGHMSRECPSGGGGGGRGRGRSRGGGNRW